MKPKTPKALKHGHETLYADLDNIISFGGNIGEKAKCLANLLYPHFKKEEEFALPPLSLLLALSQGHWEIDSQAAIEMANKLQDKHAEMKKEHGAIGIALLELRNVAEEENNSKTKRFVKDLTLHVEIEDQVLYPTTILIGNYLKNSNRND